MKEKSHKKTLTKQWTKQTIQDEKKTHTNEIKWKEKK